MRLMKKKMNFKTIDELERDLELAEEETQNAFNKLPPGLTLEEFYDAMREYDHKCASIEREIRMIKEPVFSELPTFGTVMSLEEFIDDCNSGGFIDYDGYGRYVRDGKQSDIYIHPSDIRYKRVRKDFDTIIWFNR